MRSARSLRAKTGVLIAASFLSANRRLPDTLQSDMGISDQKTAKQSMQSASNPMNKTQQTKLSHLIRVDSRYSALMLLRWYLATNRKCRKLMLAPYCTAKEARKRVIETYGWS